MIFFAKPYFITLLFCIYEAIEGQSVVRWIDLRRPKVQTVNTQQRLVPVLQNPVPQASPSAVARQPPLTNSNTPISSASKNPLKASKKFSDSTDILPILLGPVTLNPLLSSNGQVTRSQDLNCDFSSSCCWSNVETPKDELDWLVGTSDLDPARGQTLFQSGNLPTQPYLITASPSTSEKTYAVLTSCPINCQSDQGVLNLSKYTSQSVAIDVCVLPVGSSQLTSCQTVTPVNGQTSVTIPPQSQPFQITITASQFTQPPGGAAIIDDIAYAANLCPTSTTTTTTPGSNVGQVCQAINCNMDSLCAYSNGCGDNPFSSKLGPSGNGLTGIPLGPGGSGDSYASAQIQGGSKAILESQSFTVDQPTTVNFKYFDSTGGVFYKVCIDSDPTCPFSTTTDGTSGQWKDAAFVIPPGTHKLYFLACNRYGQTAYAGYDNINIASYGSTMNPCQFSSRKSSKTH